MVFNATFSNISVILWQSDLLVEVTGVLLPGGKKTFYNNTLTNIYHDLKLYTCNMYTSPAGGGIRLTTLVVK